MRVLAIDPGYDRIGIAILEKEKQQEIILYSACFETSKTDDLNTRLFCLGNEVSRLIKIYKPNTFAIEKIFFNKNIKTAIKVAEARGIMIYLAKKGKCVVYEFGPQEIKVAVTGYGKSDKNAVILMIKKLLKNIPENARDDEYDAIALGVTCLAHHGQAKYNPQFSSK